jgi:hypothetical protein
MVRVIGEWRHAAVVIVVSIVDPSYLAKINFVSPLYIIPSRPWSFRASLSCSPMHLR